MILIEMKKKYLQSLQMNIYCKKRKHHLHHLFTRLFYLNSNVHKKTGIQMFV